MIDETLQDQAALHALGMLEGGEASAFQAALKGNAELQAIVDEITEAAAALSHALPSTKAPPEVLPRLLAQIGAEQMAAPVARMPDSEAPARWMPWAIAASIALSGLTGFFSGAKVQSVNARLELRDLQRQIEQADTEKKRLGTVIAGLKDERVAMQKRVDDLRQRDALSQVQIATLKVQVKTYAKVAAYVVWDAAAQQGLMRFDNLPEAGAGKDYQMWVIDPRYDDPVSAGIFTTGSGGELDVKFKPTRPIAQAGKFAVSVEQKGGAAKPLGQIILMTN